MIYLLRHPEKLRPLEVLMLPFANLLTPKGEKQLSLMIDFVIEVICKKGKERVRYIICGYGPRLRVVQEKIMESLEYGVGCEFEFYLGGYITRINSGLQRDYVSDAARIVRSMTSDQLRALDVQNLDKSIANQFGALSASDISAMTSVVGPDGFVVPGSHCRGLMGKRRADGTYPIYFDAWRYLGDVDREQGRGIVLAICTKEFADCLSIENHSGDIFEVDPSERKVTLLMKGNVVE